MTTDPFSRTIDWNQYWTDADEDGRADAAGSAEFVVEPLLEFLAETRVLDSSEHESSDYDSGDYDSSAPNSDHPDSDDGTAFADVGCGPGATVFAVADRYPETTVVGYDAAEPVLAHNRERADREGRANVAFERAVLPEFDPSREFDVVSCFFTLCYVADPEAAIRSLYDAVAPGGYLLVTYHNRLAQSYFRSVAEDPEEHLDDSSPFDPETYADRFELVVEGESLLSYDRIHEALGTWPQSVWSAVESERYGAWRQNPLVYVPK